MSGRRPLHTLAFALLFLHLANAGAQEVSASAPMQVPKTWDEAAIASLEVPLADAQFSPKHVAAEYYDRIPVRPIFKSYPVYHPDREPPGYFEGLQTMDPKLVWGGKRTKPRLDSAADWIAAGEIVFDSPTSFDHGAGPAGTFAIAEVRDPAWYAKTGAHVDANGVLPDLRYVIRKKGTVELGSLSCANCHTRTMPDGSFVKGAQGNFPFERARAFSFRSGRRDEALLRMVAHDNFAVPWSPDDPAKRLDAMSFDAIVAMGEDTPAGVMARIRTSPFAPVQVPDLIGVKERRFLDHTGLVRQRGIADMMRYSAMNQGADGLSSFGDFIANAEDHHTLLPPEVFERYSDEQLYALAQYLYSLKPPPNPNLPKTREDIALVKRGRKVFDREDCQRCHKPESSYATDKLTPARGFKVPADHAEAGSIMSRSVDTDPALATQTRRGTGFYKVPSLLGVWYRGPFEHNGSCATLEDWFDPRRLRDDYVPTGWKGPPESKTRAVPGHEYGVDLSDDDRKALIAFLKTL